MRWVPLDDLVGLLAQRLLVCGVEVEGEPAGVRLVQRMGE